MVEARLVVTALAVILAMFLAGVQGLRHRTGIVILGLLSLSWFTIDKLFEGDVLVDLNREHAITASDLVGFVGLVATAALWFRARSQTRSGAGR